MTLVLLSLPCFVLVRMDAATEMLLGALLPHVCLLGW